MTGRSLPRYLLIAATLGLVIGGLMLTAFYVQYVWLSDELVETSTNRFDSDHLEDFQIGAQAEVNRVADTISLHLTRFPGTVEPSTIIKAALDSRSDLEGMAYITVDGFETVQGDSTYLPAGGQSGVETNAPDGMIVLEQAVPGPDGTAGNLYAQFSLDAVVQSTAEFRTMLIAADEERRATGFARILAVAGICAVLCGAVIWVVVQTQNRRLQALIEQVRRLSQADFGEPLAVGKNDDVGALVRQFNKLREDLQRTTVSRDYVDRILSGMNEAIIVTDANGQITRVNDASVRMLGYAEDDLIGRDIDTIVDSTRSGKLQLHTQGGVPDEAILLTKSGQPIPVSYTGSLVEETDEHPGARIFAAQNITERRKAEKRIRYLARIDPLTKVPNRMQFQHLLQRAIARGKRSRSAVALFYIDVDRFKEINDTFGHMAGDAALETVAKRLAEVLPEGCTIGRLAGDEFAVIVDKLRPSEETMRTLDKIARRTLNRLAEPLYVQGHEVFIGASMGIACYPNDGANVIDLIRNADAALYESKKSGGNTFTHYQPEQNEDNVERLMTKSKLKRAFERDELLVRYQPRYEVDTGKVVGAEALVRWQLPDRGTVLPADFIPLAEENDLIVQIGEWVLDRVCEDFRFWQRSVSSPGRVSVNLSLRQLRHPNFINRIAGILRSYEISPTSLELEITETTLMENPVRTIKILDELYSQGLHLAIDDFGTGYSSLSALQQFPINTLKIDRSFVRDVATNLDDATIVGTIIQMGESLNMDVVAEGVETEEQLGYLQNLGCAFVQGLLFGEPMSSDSYLDLVLAQAEGTDKYRALFA
ncbi:MAG: EAL domain-containing protein [Pseudomonadota bacterium]